MTKTTVLTIASSVLTGICAVANIANLFVGKKLSDSIGSDVAGCVTAALQQANVKIPEVKNT